MESIQQVVDALYPEILPLLNVPFIFFGHSVGSWICFELGIDRETFC